MHLTAYLVQALMGQYIHGEVRMGEQYTTGKPWCWCHILTSFQESIVLSALASLAVTNWTEVPTCPGQAYFFSWWDWGPEKYGDTPAIGSTFINCLVLAPHLSPASLFALAASESVNTPSWLQNSQNTTEREQRVLYTVSRSYQALKEVTVVKTRAIIRNIYFERLKSVLPNTSGTQYILISPNFNWSDHQKEVII